MKKCLAVLLAAVAILHGCSAVTPTVRAWRPWTRVHAAQESVLLGNTIGVSATEVSSPLFGQSALLNAELKETVEGFLIRRGFQIADENADYMLSLSYGTKRFEKLESYSDNYSWSSNKSISGSMSGSGTSSGLGVSIARAIAASIQTTSSMSSTQTYQDAQYTHTISLEIVSADGKLVWKGESTWDSPDIDIRNMSGTAIQVLLSGLPTISDKSILVPAVKDTSAAAFFKEVCEGWWFVCPATPYRIKFPDLGYDGFGIPGAIKDTRILAAVLDMIRTAEYALPKGSKNWKDPTKEILWSEVQLGGTYLIGNDKNPTYILVDLAGSRSGYKVHKCWIATDTEWTEHKDGLRRWKARLEDYYDFFEN